jgi:hypothetical protein
MGTIFSNRYAVRKLERKEWMDYEAKRMAYEDN